MLTNLRHIHKPETLDEAAGLLKQPGVYPLYGSGASLARVEGQAEEGVDLTGIVSDQYHIDKTALWIGSRTTLNALAASNPEIDKVVHDDVPEAERAALTVGDVLLECAPYSLTLAMLVGFKAHLYLHAADPMPIEDWFNLSPDERRQKIVLSVSFPEYFNGTWRLVVEKVPPEKPVVAAIGFARGGSSVTSVMMFYFAICGLADRPIRYKARDVSTLQSELDDALGSAQYRTETARAVANRVIMQAIMLAQQGKQE
jgi:CO/xanthine dehydrogenase FAD-binding subunit